MTFKEIALKDAYLVDLSPFKDDRGFFTRVFCKNEFKQIGFKDEFVQINHSMNTTAGTLRGMHYQLPPFAETKLVRCIAGKVWDVIIDLRQDSPTFLQHYGVELSAENMTMLLVPVGFAHGFQTLDNNTQLIYHHTEFYTPGYEQGIHHYDPLFNINWPLAPVNLSERDKNHNFLTPQFKGITV